MTLIELYVTEVGKRLPLRGRGDIEAELRSTLEDMLEDRSRKAGRPVDDGMTLDLLREYGPPDKVAGTYNAHPYLIGPRVMPFFIRVLQIVLASMTFALLLVLGIRLGAQPLQGPELSSAIVEGLLGIVNAAVQAFGFMVLTFAILERVLPASEFKFDDETKTWDPNTLRKAVEPEAVKPWEPIAAIAFTVAALILFNGYSDLIGISFRKDGAWTSLPILTEAFFRWLPYINVLWALQLALNVVLLRQGRWQRWTRWASIALDAAGVVIGYFLLVGPPIVAISGEALVATGAFEPAAAAALGSIAQQGTRVIILIIMIAQGVDAVKEAVRMVLRRR